MISRVAGSRAFENIQLIYIYQRVNVFPSPLPNCPPERVFDLPACCSRKRFGLYEGGFDLRASADLAIMYFQDGG